MQMRFNKFPIRYDIDSSFIQITLDPTSKYIYLYTNVYRFLNHIMKHINSYYLLFRLYYKIKNKR